METFAAWVQRARLRGRPYAELTRSSWLSDLRRFLAWCRDRGLVLTNPAGWVPEMRQGGRVPRVPSREEVVRLLDAPSPETAVGLRRRGLWELAYGTGLRLGELLALELGDLDLAEGWLVVREAKNGRERLAPVGDTATKAVLAWLEARALLWTPRAGEALWIGEGGSRLARQTAVVELQRVARPLGLRVTMHGLRHAFATHLLRAGAPVRVVQELLGHKDLRSTQLYTRVTLTDLHGMLRRHHPRSLD